MYRDILIKSVNLWLGDIISGVLPSFRNNQTMARVNGLMGSFLGLDLSNYNILTEFSFLIPSLMGNYVSNYVNQFLDALGVKDEDIPNQMAMIIDSCISRCREKGHINIFGLQFEENAFSNLKNIFTGLVSNTNTNTVANNS